MAKPVRVSLANKCQLLFGVAVVLILSAALSVVWVRMQRLVREGQENTARELAVGFLPQLLYGALQDQQPTVHTGGQSTVRIISLERAAGEAAQDPFLAAAMAQFASHRGRNEFFRAGEVQGEGYFRYAVALRQARVDRWIERYAELGEPSIGIGVPGEPADPPAELLLPDEAAVQAAAQGNPVRYILLVRVPSAEADKQLMLNRIFIVTAGLIAGLLAIAVFWFITRRIILSPVRVLRSYAEQVSHGDLHIRSEVTTGDEFEQLSDVFNTMVENLRRNTDQLRMTNKSLDLKLGELAETNVALYEANKIKGEFLANVSHELRTPLNSIVGFAEVLRETIGGEDKSADDKQKRYINNIIASSRRLLDLINDLLDLAKIEAGRMEVNVTAMSVMDTAEGLLNLLRPEADKRAIDLRLKVDPNLPIVQTDAGKVQQILFNFLSNAMKFTPDGGTITLAATAIISPAAAQRGDAALLADRDAPPQYLRISVTDTGPGIAPEHHERIFEKFTQLDPGVTRTYGGTGLGLTISRDLAQMLQGRIELTSDVDRGATFTLIIPLTLESQTVSLMPQS